MKTEWIVTETSPYSGEEPVVTAHRSVEEAREAVEREICKLLAGDSPKFDPADVYWPDENNACIGDEITWKIEPHETPTRKETDMNKLKNEARAIIENYDPKADFEETIRKLASIGYKMEEAMMHT